MKISVEVLEAECHHYYVEIVGNGRISVRSYRNRLDAHHLAEELSNVLDCAWIERRHGILPIIEEMNK
jgi:predicted ThiF/HesA family dinucleotide-utilizing enzyme